MDSRQLEALLGQQYPDQPPEATLARLLSRPAGSVPATTAGHRPASGLLGPPVPPGTAVVERVALARDHRGPATAAFAVVTPGARAAEPAVARLVLVSADWSAGLPGGRDGARVVAGELERALTAAFAPADPPLSTEVRALGGDLLAIRLVPREPSVLVAPLLHTPGFAWFAQPVVAGAVPAPPVSVAEPGRWGAAVAAALLAAVLATVVGGWAPMPAVGVAVLAVAGLLLGAGRGRSAPVADP